MDPGRASTRHRGWIPCSGAPPSPIHVCVKGAKIGSAPQVLNGLFPGMDTDAVGIRAPIHPGFAKGGDGILGSKVVNPHRRNDTAPFSDWMNIGRLSGD